ncbi:MAG: cytochrome c oxidase subunit 3 [Saprospiraceae bacterium]|nr:cytochrome c oxidase subunit 3 [Saprospiraceae bacterium]|tara:strand:- start:550 stop:1140 length:591 start_codon:yes stop_codon:yes gene_type:complete
MTKKSNYLIHPQTIILFLVLAGISALFLGFSGAYLYTKFQNGLPPLHIPPLFYFNSFILIASSITLIKTIQAFEYDNTSLFKVLLWVTMILTVVFLVAQIFAWVQLTTENVHLTSSNLASYLYVISGLHFVHVIAGIPFLGYFIWIAHKRLKSPVSVLLYFSDEDKKRSLKLLTIYWHFLDGLWIYLILFFLVNSF